MKAPLLRVGVLCLQGSFAEHITRLRNLGAEVTEVRLPSHLNGIEGLIIPGGESTTFLKLIELYNLREPLCQAIKQGLPVLATCAGVVILASRISSHSMKPLSMLDIELARNAFGRQVESFEEDLTIEGITGLPFRGVFIRAPIIRSCGPSVRVLARVQNGTIVACQQDRILATSFHPEFVPDTRVHELFLRLVAEARRGTSSTDD
ncbi:MAG: pyridoxal 5'-phosphate synthase glutaminase subunit PdxT [Dehalococcoidia bacterium]|nr:pyridoxal 5'-phosphate synthase glutaminase subunit PdxT [Dehalococcoidia bacterium]